jgi:hypothetical protein
MITHTGVPTPFCTHFGYLNLHLLEIHTIYGTGIFAIQKYKLRCQVEVKWPLFFL